jgi:hypothetical protein
MSDSLYVSKAVESERLVGASTLLTTCTSYKHFLFIYTLRLIE